ncbi:MAG: FeoB-associated Cys-rich membrane protein [Oscillibacter sp.]|nr:FeoB-associated Cys-rich membrane protein [Oscillibacter sp.]MBQ7680675.1 FeoB-associated Cys-rich membrane protein [Oscillibacter sp.]MBQ9618262.1 FeoB-associated Cys-rich membrane protein [Oscillibacter sp.]
MSAILGNAVALLLVALLVAVCVRNLWKDAKQGGCGSGCAGCAGCANGSCIHCAGHVRKGKAS